MSDRAQMLATAMQAPRRPTVDTAVEQYFGMKPGMDRLNLLPRHDSKQGWVAPNMVYQLARAMVSPGVAAHGGDVSPEDAVNFAGNVSLGSFGASAAMKNPTPGPGKTLPMTVYHGSPHDFDKFDMSKIGTGEGAQAYGHGLYLADNPKVAGTYSELGASRFFVDGNEIPPSSNWDAQLRADITAYRHPSSLDREIESLRDHAKTFGNAKSAEAADILAAGKANPARISERKGHLYTADLPDEHIAKMLDWDKPLSQQPAHVQDAVKSAFADAGIPNAWKSDPDGNSVNAWLSSAMKDSQKASELLRAKGLSGIKYLDGGSRAAGDGTRNYVVFDDKLLKILRKE